MIVILCGCSAKSIFPSCAHPLAGSRLVPTPSLGRGSYPCRHRFLACRDKVQVFGVNSAIYIISVVSAGCASAIVMCGRRCPLNGRIFLSVVRSRFLSLVNLRIQPCKPLRIHLANLSSCSLAVIVFYCLDMGLDYIFPPYPMSRAIWQWLTFTFTMQPQICVDRGCSRSIRSSARLFEEARSYSQHEESTNTTLHPESSCDCRFVNESDRGMCSSQGANCVEPVFAERRSRPGP